MAKKDVKKISPAAVKAAKKPVEKKAAKPVKTTKAVKAVKPKAIKPKAVKARAAPKAKVVKAVPKIKAKPVKAKAKKAKPLVRGKVVKHEGKRLNKHVIKKTGEEIRFEGPKKVDGVHQVHVHGKLVDEGIQLVTTAAQSGVMSSLRGSARIPLECKISFRK